MRERARKIRAHLDLWSKPGAGTEIELRLPAELAYRKKRRITLRRWWLPARSISRTSRGKPSSDAVTERRQ
jgi:hypothetical protein